MYWRKIKLPLRQSYFGVWGEVLRDLVEELVHHFPDALVEEGDPHRRQHLP